MRNMFSNCLSLLPKHDISMWNKKNVKYYPSYSYLKLLSFFKSISSMEFEENEISDNKNKENEIYLYNHLL